MKVLSLEEAEARGREHGRQMADICHGMTAPEVKAYTGDQAAAMNALIAAGVPKESVAAFARASVAGFTERLRELGATRTKQ